MGIYDSSTRTRSNQTASYKCSSEADSVTGYVGTLLADEVAYAGGIIYSIDNRLYYLHDNAENDYRLLSRYHSNGGFDQSFIVESYGILESGDVDSRYAVRPAVTIATGAEYVSGDGTQNNPYKIK